jgi:L-lactate dehydrogenase complex protein LldF
VEAVIWKVWAQVYKSPTLYALSMWGLTRFRFFMPKKLGGWTSVRTAPKPAAKTLHERLKSKQEKARKSKQLQHGRG